MFSQRCSRRISGSDRELPSPPKPEGLMIGATGLGLLPSAGSQAAAASRDLRQIGDVN